MGKCAPTDVASSLASRVRPTHPAGVYQEVYAVPLVFYSIGTSAVAFPISSNLTVDQIRKVATDGDIGSRLLCVNTVIILPLCDQGRSLGTSDRTSSLDRAFLHSGTLVLGLAVVGILCTHRIRVYM